MIAIDSNINDVTHFVAICGTLWLAAGLIIWLFATSYNSFVSMVAMMIIWPLYVLRNMHKIIRSIFGFIVTLGHEMANILYGRDDA